MNEVKKIVKAELKKQSVNFAFGNIISKYKRESIVFLDSNSEVGYIGYTFVSSKYADYNSLFGIFLSCRFGLEMSGTTELTKIIEKLKLSFPPMAKLPQCYFGFTSLYFSPLKFYNNGTISFYENDDIVNKCIELTQNVNDIFIPYIYNFINVTPALTNDILEYPYNYGYPLTCILIQCILNHNYSDIPYLVKLAREKKMYDSTSNKINEIIERLNKYFGTNIDC